VAYRVTLIPGDGIGPEVSEAARRVIDATGVPIEWEVREAGLTALESQGDVLPEETLASLKRNTVGLKGPMPSPGIKVTRYAIASPLPYVLEPSRSAIAAPASGAAGQRSNSASRSISTPGSAVGRTMPSRRIVSSYLPSGRRLQAVSVRSYGWIRQMSRSPRCL
jgi:hypothetical protein